MSCAHWHSNDFRTHASTHILENVLVVLFDKEYFLIYNVELSFTNVNSCLLVLFYCCSVRRNIYINILIAIQYLKQLQFDLILTALPLGLLNHIQSVFNATVKVKQLRINQTGEGVAQCK